MLACAGAVSDKTCKHERVSIHTQHFMSRYGSSEAARALGTCYMKGQGVPPDFQKACDWYRKGAEVGAAGCCSRVYVWSIRVRSLSNNLFLFLFLFLFLSFFLSFSLSLSLVRTSTLKCEISLPIIILFNYLAHLPIILKPSVQLIQPSCRHRRIDCHQVIIFWRDV